MKLIAKIIIATSILAFTNIANSCTKCNCKKTVVITGGMTGIGKEMAKTFKQDGWHVWTTSRTPEAYEQIEGVTSIKLDLTNEREVASAMNKIKESTGRIDVLVNNAGYGMIGSQETTSTREAEEMFDANVFSVMRTSKAVIPMMRQQKNGGHIINVSSTSGVRAVPGLGTYAASKMALEGISEAMAAELKPLNIKVSILEPGTVNNAWAKNCNTTTNSTGVKEYDNLANNVEKKLVTLAANGQSQTEIADLTLQIAKNDAPDLRYQTSKQAMDVVASVYTDATGNAMNNKMIEFTEDMYKA